MLYLRIDKEKVYRKMREKGIEAWNDLGDLTRSEGLSTRSMYDVMDSQDWSTKQLYALCKVLECNPVDILSIDMGRGNSQKKQEAPSEPRISFNLAVMQDMELKAR